MVNTITVVGYGTFLPDYKQGGKDVLLIMVAIYIGTVMFSKFAGPLNRIFSNSLRLITIEKRILSMEDNFWIFVIDNNAD
jgi:antibiotic biosynthesis monooxygenase (ABM) superfamily enzyme